MNPLNFLALLGTLAVGTLADYSIGAKNGYPGVSTWVTLYSSDLLGIRRNIVASRCLKSGEEGIMTYTGDTANCFVRAELKQREDCGGDTLSDSTINANAGGGNWVTLLPQFNFPQTYWTTYRSPVAQPIDSSLPPPVETVIFSRVRGGQSIALSVDPSNRSCVQGGPDGQCNVIIDNYQPGNANQIWLRQKTGNGYLFTNKATQMLAYVPNGNGNRIVMMSKTSINIIGSVWTLGGDCRVNCSLRPYHDDGQNMNIFGNGPYGPGRAVGTWGWGGGDVNETWFMSPSP